jgi:anti-sigma factor RsiW
VIRTALKLCKKTACRSLRAHLSEYLDGELSSARELLAQRHLRSCVACAAEYRAFRSLVKACQKLPQPELPSSFKRRLSLVFRNWSRSSQRR